ncbi:tetratricopeptide repeat protein [Candidatus Poribacteria bacterium]
MRFARFEPLIYLLLIPAIFGCGLKTSTPPEHTATDYTPVDHSSTDQIIPEAASESSSEVAPEVVEEYARIHQMSNLKTAELYLTDPDYAREHPYNPTEEDIAFYERSFLEKMYPKFKEYADKDGFMKARRRFMANPTEGAGSIRIGAGSDRYTTFMRGLTTSGGEGAYTKGLNPTFEGDPAASHYLDAMIFHRDGKLNDAIASMEKAVKIKPNAPGFLYNLGVMYAEKGNYAKARSALQNCLDHIKSTAYTKANLAMHSEIYMGAATNLGLIYTRIGMYDEAVKSLGEAIKFRPDDISANLNLGTTYYVMGDMEKAIAQMRKCLRLAPDNGGLHNTIGLIYYQQQLHNAALDEFQTAEKLAPGEKQYSYNVGLVLAELKRYDEANQAFERASGLAEGEYTRQTFSERTRANDARKMYNDGYAAMQRYELDSAIDLFQAALKLKPDIVEAHINLGVCYRTRGKRKEQIHHFEEAAKLRPGMPDVHYNLGLAYSDAKMYPQAIAELDRTIELKPSYRDAHFKLGTILYKQKRFIDAAAEFRRCVELSPKWFEAYLNLGSCYIKTRNADGAIESFEKVVELKPRSAEAHYNLGAAYMLAERYGEASAQFQKTLDIDSTYRRARLMLKQLEIDNAE